MKTEITNNTIRYEWVDILKGLAIISVVLGHMGVLVNYFYSFHMPLFIFCSGILYRKRTGKELIRYIVVKLLYPYYAIASLLNLSLYVFTKYCWPSMYPKFSNVIGQEIHILLGGGYPQCIIAASPPMWFLPALTCVILIYFFISGISNVFLRAVAVVALCICGLYMLSVKTLIYFPYNIDVALVMLPFFCLGKALAGRSEFMWPNTRTSFKTLICIGMLFLAHLGTSAFQGRVNINTGNYGGSIPSYYVVGTVGILTWCCIAKALNNTGGGYFGGLLALLGRQSLGIMCLHPIFTTVIVMGSDGVLDRRISALILAAGFMGTIGVTFLGAIVVNRILYRKNER